MLVLESLLFSWSLEPEEKSLPTFSTWNWGYLGIIGLFHKIKSSFMHSSVVAAYQPCFLCMG